MGSDPISERAVPLADRRACCHNSQVTMSSLLLAAFACTSMVFGVCAVGNAFMPIAARRTGRSYSMAPLVGGLAGVIAALLAPWSLPTWVISLPLVLDLERD